MDVVADLVARDRRSDALAVRTDSRAGSYSYEKLCTTAWKTGNLLSHYGVRGGATVAIDTGEALTPPPLTAFLGAGLLGATIRFDPPESVDAQAFVAPAERLARYDPAPGTQVLAYGDDPDDPTAAHFEREVWSENPVMPPDDVGSDADLLVADGNCYSHERLLDAAGRVAGDRGLDAEDLVAVRAPLANPSAVAAGILAPLTVGGAILVDSVQTGTVAVGATGPEAERVDPTTVL